jgi:hypothetical protein
VRLSSPRACVLRCPPPAAAPPPADNAVELHADLVSCTSFAARSWTTRGRSSRGWCSTSLGAAPPNKTEAQVRTETGSRPTRTGVRAGLTLSLSHELSETVLVWAGPTYYWLPFADVDLRERWRTTEVPASVDAVRSRGGTRTTTSIATRGIDQLGSRYVRWCTPRCRLHRVARDRTLTLTRTGRTRGRACGRRPGAGPAAGAEAFSLGVTPLHLPFDGVDEDELHLVGLGVSGT